MNGRQYYLEQLQSLLTMAPAVVLVGPRQIGKTTLALALRPEPKAIYRDLERPQDADQVRDIELFVSQYPNALLILDEVQRLPQLFAPLRGLIDTQRRQGKRHGQFLLLGSASLELLQQASESLAGRITVMELPGFNLLEVNSAEEDHTNTLWLRGAYPDSFLADTDGASLHWRTQLIRSYLEREVPQFGFRIPAETLRRFWSMLAHHQGAIFNAAGMAKNLAVSGQSIARYLDVLVDLLLVRRLQPWHSNVGKRLVKSPKVYVRDSGLVHALLDIGTLEQLHNHPVVGNSWEGYVLEQLLSCVNQDRYQPYYYRTQRGAELDLLLVRAGVPEIAIEIKRASAPKPEKGFHIACDDLQIKQRYLVYPGHRRYLLPTGVEVVPMIDLMEQLRR
jgi:uncharacterized protein